LNHSKANACNIGLTCTLFCYDVPALLTGSRLVVVVLLLVVVVLVVD